MNFKDGVNDAYKKGWVAHPLTLDKDGFPKVPITRDWAALKHDSKAIRNLSWDRAAGMGLVLGPESSNLAVLDLDDVELTNAVFALLIRGHVWTRLVFSARKRGHVYFREETPSRSTVQKVKFQGRDIKVELKAQGTQVAAPPTPGYTLCLDREPQAVPSIAAAWDSIWPRVGVEIVGPTGGSAGFPKPWQDTVTKGERDQASYIEAHKLREAGIPVEQALELMQIRFEQAYDKAGITWGEIEKTIISAYRKPVSRPLWEAYEA